MSPRSGRGEEPARELVPLGLRRVEPRPVLGDEAPRPDGVLAAGRRRPADDPADLLEVVVEHVVEEEDRPLDRGQPLEQDEERHRQRVGLLGVRRRVAGALVGHERLRQPLADVRLAPDARRA